MEFKEPRFRDPMPSDHREHSNIETWSKVLVIFLVGEIKDFIRCNSREERCILVCSSPYIMMRRIWLKE